MNYMNVPGMVEPIERQMLNTVAKSLTLGEDDQIIEFGSFFGASAAAILDGVQQKLNGTPRAPVLFLVDAFRCHQAGSFFPHVLAYAKQFGLENLLRYEDQIVDWKSVVENNLRPFRKELFELVPAYASDFRVLKRPIALIHFDMPKWYAELKPLLVECAPYLKPGAIIIFQDFLYHWSAELASVAWHLVHSEKLSVQAVAASSLCCRLEKNLAVDEIGLLDEQILLKNVQFNLMNALKVMGRYGSQFDLRYLYRLRLAAAQALYESGDSAAAATALEPVLRFPDPNRLADIQDLIRYGFSLRKLYEKDLA
jgi:hypothetical protein